MPISGDWKCVRLAGVADGAEPAAVGHVPHLYLPGPWEGSSLALGNEHTHHLAHVLRMREGVITYTDGRGKTGSGLLADGAVVRGDERQISAPRPALTLLVAPPRDQTRVRFLIEKAGELGVTRVGWLDAAHRVGKPPKPAKAEAWAVAALQQSRRAWKMAVDDELTSPEDVEPPCLYADRDGRSSLAGIRSSAVTVAIGPEGGWAPGEADGERVSLGQGVLRTETAALAVAAIVLGTS